MLPYFKRGERRLGVADDRIHGRSGALPVTDNDWIHPAMEAFLAGARELGMPRCKDYNSGDDQLGVGCFQRLIQGGYRRSAFGGAGVPVSGAGDRAGGGADSRTGRRDSVRRHAGNGGALCA